MMRNEWNLVGYGDDVRALVTVLMVKQAQRILGMLIRRVSRSMTELGFSRALKLPYHSPIRSLYIHIPYLSRLLFFIPNLSLTIHHLPHGAKAPCYVRRDGEMETKYNLKTIRIQPRPKLPSQEGTNDLVRDLDLLKDAAELFG